MPIFAKIQGKTLYADNDDDEELPDINLDITHTKVFLGRADAYPADESLGPHMGTCHSKSVSRRHLTISWDPDRDQWQLYVDSKNGVVVDCVEIEATARPSWLGRAVRNEHHHAIEQASRRWRGGRRDDSAQGRQDILIYAQAMSDWLMTFISVVSLVFLFSVKKLRDDLRKELRGHAATGVFLFLLFAATVVLSVSAMRKLSKRVVTESTDIFDHEV